MSDLDEFGGAPAVPDPDVLQSDKRGNIMDRLVGEQISRVVLFEDLNPQNGRMVGLRMVSAASVCFWMLPAPAGVRATGFCSGVLPTYFDRLPIVTPRMAKAMRSDRAVAENNDFFRRIEGELILGYAFHDDTPNAYGGETLELTLTDGHGGQDFSIHSGPGDPSGIPSATYILALKLRPERRVMFLPLQPKGRMRR